MKQSRLFRSLLLCGVLLALRALLPAAQVQEPLRPANVPLPPQPQPLRLPPRAVEPIERLRPLQPLQPLEPLQPRQPSASPRRILLVDDDWYNNSPGVQVRPSGSDQVFRMLVDSAVGGDAKAWSTEMVASHAHGPSIDRLRDFAVVIWYTGASYGGSADGVATLSIEDEKTVRRYLEETGGTFFLFSPGFLSTRSYATTWTDHAHPFIKEVMGVRGFASLTKRFAGGTVRSSDGNAYAVADRGVVETQFTAVNPTDATPLFTSTFPRLEQNREVPVSILHRYGRGQFVYVGFSLENLPEEQRQQVFDSLLAAATGERTPGAPASSPGVTDPPVAFSVTGSGRDSLNFSASHVGPIRVAVQNSGEPVTVAILHPDGRTVEQTGTGSFTVTDQVSEADLAKGHVWGVVVRAATTSERATIVASGTLTVTHPPADDAAVQAQMTTIPQRTTVLSKAQAVRTVSLRETSASHLRAMAVEAPASSDKALVRLPADAISGDSLSLQTQALERVGTVLAPPPPPSGTPSASLPPPPPSGAQPASQPPAPTGPLPVPRFATAVGGANLKLKLRGPDLFPPNTRVEQVMRAPEQYAAQLQIVHAGQTYTVPLTAYERRLPYPDSLNDTQTDTQVIYWRNPDSTNPHYDHSAPVKDLYERWYEGTMPKIVMLEATTLAVRFVSKDGRISAPIHFQYQPAMRDMYLSLPLANRQLVDSTLAASYPNADLTYGNIFRDTFLLGFSGYDTFYNTLELRNGWKVVGAWVNETVKAKGGAEVVEWHPGTHRPFVKVRWYLEPTFLDENMIAYTIQIHIRGPADFPAY